MKVVVYGAPGCGKTQYAVDFISQKYDEGFSLQDFCVSTFRKPLAVDMCYRIMAATESFKLTELLIGTTHAICKRLLVVDKIADSKEKAEFCKERGIEYSKKFDQPTRYHMEPMDRSAPLGNHLFNILSYCANNFLKPREGIYRAPLPPGMESQISPWLIDGFAGDWAEWKEKKGLYDFTDLLLEVLESKVTPDTKFLIEDEFHDKTPLQYEVYKLWAKNTENVMVLADPLQCIYSFFGTTPRFFENEWRTADERVILHRSWRFGQDVWEYAREIVEREGMATPEIECMGSTRVHWITWGQFIHVLPQFERERCMYLVRANYMARYVAEELSNVGIPYSGVSGGLSDKAIYIYNAFCAVRQKLSTLGVFKTESLFKLPFYISLPKDEALWMVETFPRRCFPKIKKKIKSEISLTSALTFPVPITPEVAAIARDPFVNLVNLREHRKAQLIRLYHRRGGRRLEKLSHTISTIHGAKGRQSDVIFLFDEITPTIYRNMLQRQEDRENEARVFYVGSTRPKKSLFVVHGPWGKLSYQLPEVLYES